MYGASDLRQTQLVNQLTQRYFVDILISLIIFMILFIFLLLK